MLVKVKKPSKINKFIKLGLSECTINYLGTINPELEKAFANQRKEKETVKKQYRNENSLNVEDVVQKLYESHGGIGKVPEFNFDEISDAIYTIMNYIGGKGHRQTIKEKEAEKEIEAFFEKLIKINGIS